ncbi:MAG: 50S ribosomal protein L29 [Paludibacteraceae bacterium]|jgi:large subunit ribosomal protein L29|nr:50S ribosomal protein L29 [Bacteroidales bacterium]MBQ5926055.1 50S ribosomal protein L29 [Paludibacteraceae bacterium]MBR4154015.1 50S ribosomal protein L29 [Paludibacteraceae bacterium]MBR5238718.1 50S ribosomal protein L29 [Paludibacteraceae bacterium]
MKTREIKELTTAEIQDRLVAEKENLTRMTLNHAISPLDNPALIRETRRTIARLATELRQRELNQQ